MSEIRDLQQYREEKVENLVASLQRSIDCYGTIGTVVAAKAPAQWMDDFGGKLAGASATVRKHPFTSGGEIATLFTSLDEKVRTVQPTPEMKAKIAECTKVLKAQDAIREEMRRKIAGIDEKLIHPEVWQPVPLTWFIWVVWPALTMGLIVLVIELIAAYPGVKPVDRPPTDTPPPGAPVNRVKIC